MPPKYFNTYKALNVTTGKLGCYTLLGTVGGLVIMVIWRERRQYVRLGETTIWQVGRTGIRKAIPANTRHWTNPGSILGRRRRWWANIEPTLVQYLVFSWNFLPCKAKRQYLITSQVSRYCLLALQSSYVGGWIDEMPSIGCIQPTEYRWPINIPTKGPVHT